METTNKKQYIYKSCERMDAVVKHVVRSNSHLQAEPVHTRWEKLTTLDARDAGLKISGCSCICVDV